MAGCSGKPSGAKRSRKKAAWRRAAGSASPLSASFSSAYARIVSSSRWRLLETIRAYALEKLAESGEAEPAARRHAAFFRDLFAPDGLPLQPAIVDLARYAREMDNVRAALGWAF